LIEENEELKKQVDDLTQQLAQEKAEEQTQFNPEQIQELEGQVSKLIEENEELKKQVDDLTQQLAQEKAEEQTQFNPEQIQELEGQISKLIQDNQVKVTDLEKQLNTEKEQYEAKLAELEEQNKNLDAAISRLERELKELKILSPTSPSSHLPPLVVQLVGFFNQSPQSLLNEIDKYKYHEVTETAKSSRERRGSVDSKDVVLETPETCIGDFLIVEIGKGSSYLFPKYQLISEGLAQTAKALFKGYSDKTSFELIRPAKVSFIGGNWKLDEQGELKHNN
jgi:myosin heavy subunit